MYWLPWWAYPAACCVITGGVCGWLLGYAHREFIEWGRTRARLLAWRRKYRRRGLLTCVLRAYSELFADIRRLCCTGRWT